MTSSPFSGQAALQEEIDDWLAICGENSTSVKKTPSEEIAPTARITRSTRPSRRPLGKLRMSANVSV